MGIYEDLRFIGYTMHMNPKNSLHSISWWFGLILLILVVLNYISSMNQTTKSIQENAFDDKVRQETQIDTEKEYR